VRLPLPWGSMKALSGVMSLKARSIPVIYFLWLNGCGDINPTPDYERI